jgi:hypothetical protein
MNLFLRLPLAFLLLAFPLLVATEATAFEPFGAGKATLARVAVGKLHALTGTCIKSVQAIQFLPGNDPSAMATKFEALALQCGIFIDESSRVARYYEKAFPDETWKLFVYLGNELKRSLHEVRMEPAANRAKAQESFTKKLNERLELLWSKILNSEDRGM